jgi:DNA-binding response OmpR family regulator
MVAQRRSRILVVEDEPRLGELVRLYLEREGYTVTVVADGRAAIAAFDPHGADAEPIDLVVLDLMLPGLAGEAVLAAIRDLGETPVLITSAKRSDAERITGLRLGADDYLAKPYNPHELTARVAAILRRTRPVAPHAADDAPANLSLAGGRLVLEPATRRFTLRATADAPGTAHGDADPAPTEPETVVTAGRLTPGEAGLLLALARQPGAVLSRDQLLDVVTRRPDEVVDRVVDVHVANLRRKVGDDPVDPWLIETIPQTGYRLIAVRDAETVP